MDVLMPSFELDERVAAAVRELFRGGNARWPEGADEAAALRAIVEQGMAPLVYERVARNDDWPPSLVAALRAQALAVAAAEATRARALVSALEALERAGVTAIVIKGTALAYRHYPSPALRPRGDTDLLVAEDEVGRAREALRGAGFTEENVALHGQTTFAGGETLDLHWRVANSPAFEHIVSSDERAVALPALSPHARTLPDEEALLLACVHRVVHHYGSERLIWLYDIELLRERVEWERFLSLAAEKRMLAVCEDGIRRAHAWFGRTPLGDFPPHAGEPSAAYLRGGLRVQLEARELRALPRWRDRARRVRELLFPPPAYMFDRYRTESRALLPLLYLRRACAGGVRLFQRLR